MPFSASDVTFRLAADNTLRGVYIITWPYLERDGVYKLGISQNLTERLKRYSDVLTPLMPVKVIGFLSMPDGSLKDIIKAEKELIDRWDDSLMPWENVENPILQGKGASEWVKIAGTKRFAEAELLKGLEFLRDEVNINKLNILYTSPKDWIDIPQPGSRAITQTTGRKDPSFDFAKFTVLPGGKRVKIGNEELSFAQLFGTKGLTRHFSA